MEGKAKQLAHTKSFQVGFIFRGFDVFSGSSPRISIRPQSEPGSSESGNSLVEIGWWFELKLKQIYLNQLKIYNLKHKNILSSKLFLVDRIEIEEV